MAAEERPAVQDRKGAETAVIGEIWTIPQAAKALGMAEKTVRFLIKQKILPSIRTRGGEYLLDPDDVRRYDAERHEKIQALRDKRKGAATDG